MKNVALPRDYEFFEFAQSVTHYANMLIIKLAGDVLQFKFSSDVIVCSKNIFCNAVVKL